MRPRRPTRSRARRRTGVDAADLGAFGTPARRAAILRLGFAAAAVALVVGMVANARELEARRPGLVPSGTTGVAVVDLSLSVTDDDYQAVRGAFRRLIADGASVGLVVFSDVPYELLPPGTPASELRPMLRLLVPPRLGSTVNPWNETFRSGTRVSTALQLARSMLERDGVQSGSILLVSDLETAPDDVPALTRTVEDLRRSSIRLRVVGLSPSSDARLIFAGLMQEGPFRPSPSGREEAAGSSATAVGLPTALLVLGALSLLALAAHERFGGMLAIVPGRGGRAWSRP